MLRKILGWGLLAGLIVGSPMSTMATSMTIGLPSMVVGYLIMRVAFSTVFLAVKRHRDDELGGVIRFWPAFAIGLAISFVASLIYVLAWEFTLAATQMDFAGKYAAVLIEQQKAQGTSGEALAKYVADLERFKADYANPLYRLPMTFTEIFPVGLLVSLLSAALLRNSRFLPARRA
jgi:hypothetical protein